MICFISDYVLTVSEKKTQHLFCILRTLIFRNNKGLTKLITSTCI